VKIFFTDFTVGESYPEASLFNIAIRYLKGDFLIDFIPLIPITLLIPHQHEYPDVKLFYLVKVIRLRRGLRVFNV
jgi:hypothetical protein